MLSPWAGELRVTAFIAACAANGSSSIHLLFSAFEWTHMLRLTLPHVIVGEHEDMLNRSLATQTSCFTNVGNELLPKESKLPAPTSNR